MIRPSWRVLVVCVLLAPMIARADEVQVPLDEAGSVQELEGARARALGLFPEAPDLIEARLYEDFGRFTLEITELKAGQRVRRRLPLTAERVAELRRKVSTSVGHAQLSAPPPPPDLDAQAGPAATPPPSARPPPHPDAARPGAPAAPRGPVLNQEGRWLLIGTSTFVGLGYYGWAVPVGLRINTTGAVGAYMLVSGASFFLPFWLTRDTDVTWGMTNMFYAGATRGPLHATLLLSALNVSDFSSIALGTAGLGMAEAIAGTLWAHAANLSAGQAHTIASANDFGLGFGLGIGVLATGQGPSFGGGFQAVNLAGLVGAVAGTVGGVQLARIRDYTWGDAESIATAGLLGAYSMLPVIAFSSTFQSPRLASGLLMLGAAGGLVAGDVLIRGKHFSPGQGILVDLGTLAGGLIGYGAVLAVGSGFDVNAALTASALGGLGGFAITYVAFGSAPLEIAEGVKMNLTFDPGALTRKVGISNRQPALALTGVF